MGFWQSRCLAVATELDLAEQLAGGPLAVEVLATRTATDSLSLFRLLTSPAGVVDAVHGCDAWEWYQQRPETISVFNETLQSLSAVITPAVSTGYDWSRLALIADIGGGIGTQLAAILNAHPSCRGVLFDQPSVIQPAPEHDRMDCILRWIIHDWADAPALAILTNIRKAMKPGARLLLIEEIVPEPPKPTMGMWLDPHMLVLHNGRERTRSEYASRYERAGFDLEEVVPTASPHSIIIGSPRA